MLVSCWLVCGPLVGGSAGLWFALSWFAGLWFACRWFAGLWFACRWFACLWFAGRWFARRWFAGLWFGHHRLGVEVHCMPTVWTVPVLWVCQRRPKGTSGNTVFKLLRNGLPLNCVPPPLLSPSPPFLCLWRCSDHHGPAKVNIWQDPTNPGNWKEAVSHFSVQE